MARCPLRCASTERSKENLKGLEKLRLEGGTEEKASLFLPCRSQVDPHSVSSWIKF